mmetsp:Transcript_95937/g.277050  ORF Transcript_95937/g.277050 Transcript_95937/m.277050 type:complete len:185 (+) Transcript_95937:83-637(+)
MGAPMVGLAYFPLALWIPLVVLQSVAAIHLGRGMQAALRGITGLLVDSPLCYFLKIVWVVMLVLALDCARNALMTGVAKSGSADSDAYMRELAFELHAAKEGALVFGLNLVCMMAIQSLHFLQGESIRLERDRDMMKRQAEQQGQFAKNLIQAEEKKPEKAVPKETPMPEAKKDEAEGEMRKRD